MGNETLKKVNCYWKYWHRKIPVDQTDSAAHATFSSSSHRHCIYVLCTNALSPFQTTISQLKCLCHLLSCLKLISFFSWGGGRGGERKRTEKKQWQKEAEKYKELRQSKDSEPTCGRKEWGSASFPCFCMVSVHYHSTIMVSSLPPQAQP